MQLPDDPFIRELLPEFIDDWIDQIQQNFDEYVQSNNFEDMYRLGHTLKGSCLQFGLDDLAAIGIEIMNFCKEQQMEQVIPMKQKLLSTFTYVKSLV
ncbi:MAG: Hpt domain-containing protein [Candidatus Kapabacteria bacterium]|nr:Hpt domain-containing protein [Candidatus Kapabacteria bacterium]